LRRDHSSKDSHCISLTNLVVSIAQAIVDGSYLS